jgi:hypothetical protein
MAVFLAKYHQKETIDGNRIILGRLKTTVLRRFRIYCRLFPVRKYLTAGSVNRRLEQPGEHQRDRHAAEDQPQVHCRNHVRQN